MLVVILFLYAALSFTAATVTTFIGGDALLAQLAILTVPTLFLASIYGTFRSSHAFWRVLGKVSSVTMGFLNFAFNAALVCWPVAWIAALTGFSGHRPAIAWTLLGLSFVFALYGVFNAAWLRVTRYTVLLPNLPAGWRGRELAVVSDIHVGAIRGPAFVRRIVARLKALKPAAVLIPGDMFDGAKVDVAAAVQPWADFPAPAGVYFTSGNHDEFADRTPYLDALTKVGVKVLNNEKVTVDGLQIIGIHDGETHQPALYRELLARAQIDPTQPSILLAHRPGNLDIPAKAGVSLQVAGHTHAGQFPMWTWLVWRIYRRFSYGLNRWGSLQVLTSSGAGTGGPPLRFGTRAEIVMIRLEPTATAEATPPAR